MQLLFLPEYEVEMKSTNKPLVIRAYFHEDHAHILRIDAQGGARGYHRVDVFNETSPKTGDGFTIEYKCELCGQIFSLNTKRKGIPIQNENSANINANIPVPELDPTYTCIHTHKSGNSMHAYNIRVTNDGKIMYCKPISIISQG